MGDDVDVEWTNWEEMTCFLILWNGVEYLSEMRQSCRMSIYDWMMDVIDGTTKFVVDPLWFSHFRKDQLSQIRINIIFSLTNGTFYLFFKATLFGIFWLHNIFWLERGNFRIWTKWFENLKTMTQTWPHWISEVTFFMNLICSESDWSWRSQSNCQSIGDKQDFDHIGSQRYHFLWT